MGTAVLKIPAKLVRSGRKITLKFASASGRLLYQAVGPLTPQVLLLFTPAPASIRSTRTDLTRRPVKFVALQRLRRSIADTARNRVPDQWKCPHTEPRRQKFFKLTRIRERIPDDSVEHYRDNYYSITNLELARGSRSHSYLDNPNFLDMRQHLMQTFDRIYIMDLHGNAKK